MEFNRDDFSYDEEAELEEKVPIKAMRDRLYKIHKDITKFNKELNSFHKTLLERPNNDGGQDSEVMKATVIEMGKAAAQLEAAYKWISFMNEYGPIQDG
jgi:hypothetical protein